MVNEVPVFVVGAGVAGLSTAIRAQEAGFNVTIFAETFPGDKKTIKYTSCWAAANHISVATTNALLHQLERETLSVFLEMLKKDPLIPAMIRPHEEHVQVLGPEGQKQLDHLSKCYSDFRLLEPNELPEGVTKGAVYSTICIDVPRYLPWLLERFLALGGRAFRGTLPSLSALLSEEDRPSPLINCTGIGARSIGDVLDADVYPTRGEVLIIRAPWIKHGLSYYYEDGHLTYAIPRQSGDVILGGSFQVDDWHPTSRPEMRYPELLPPNKREARNIADLDVVEECGVRLGSHVLDKSLPIVHNYGHGGAGYQSSWGSAKAAVDLLKSAVNE
ncbi:D-amino-acid oxidase [Mycena olivaceomarginata]|nr:D-amino-acid oxidase [Mycena olivaceomarginata]